MDGPIVARISRDQFLMWLDHYYHDGQNTKRHHIGQDFSVRFEIGQTDLDIHDRSLEEQDVLDLIEERYVEAP